MTCAWNWAAVDWEMYERTQAAVTAQLLDEIIEVQSNAPQPEEFHSRSRTEIVTEFRY